MTENIKPLARLEKVFKHDPCEECGTYFTFGFATPEGMHVISMKDIIQCIRELERHQHITELPWSEWWLYTFQDYRPDNLETNADKEKRQ